MSPLSSWALAFGLTFVIEAPVASSLLSASEPRRWRRLSLVLFAQLLSHPSVWWIFPQLPVGYEAMVALAETWAVVSEAVFYAVVLPGLSPSRALATAALANAASYGAGLLLYPLWG